MKWYDFIGFKSSFELLSISELIEKGPSQIDSPQQSDIFWVVLERKIRNTFWYKGQRHSREERTPSIKKLLELKTSKTPPFLVLRTFIEMCHSMDAYQALFERYPNCVNVRLLNGDLLLHRVIETGGYQSKHIIYAIICRSIVLNYKSIEFGGLTLKNNSGLSPLIKLFGLVAVDASRNPNGGKWMWLKGLLRRAVHIELHHNNMKADGIEKLECYEFENEQFLQELQNTPLIHAALHLDCPLGLLHRIIDSCSVDDFCQQDSFGRIPLMIALSNKFTAAEIVVILFRKTPVRVLQLLNIDKKGDLPLHRILKVGIKYKSRSESDLSLIATVAETAPDGLFTCDKILNMPPFMLACINNQWSLGVIYGLLRAGPCAIEPYVEN